MNKHPVTASASGHDVYVNLIASLAGQYLSRQPYVLNLVKEVLEPMHLKDQSILIEHDMGRVIRNIDIVETSEQDTIFYAQSNKISFNSRYATIRYTPPLPTLRIVL